jgi:hypothetical protein
MSTSIEQVLNHLRKPFVIKEDGSSQTQLTNHGRVGFFIERLFGILPNNSRRPDLGYYELKTTQYGKKISISTMSDREFLRIKKQTYHCFEQSYPYEKIKNTLLVIYNKIESYPEPKYCLDGWALLHFETLPDYIKTILQNDYDYICRVIQSRCKSRDHVTQYLRDYGCISGRYLTLGYKGQGNSGYNYPSWGFQAKFMKQLTQYHA